MAGSNPKPIPALKPKQIARFWSYVDKTPGQGPKGDCHEWKGGRFPSGYGSFGINNRAFRSHRVAFFIVSGIDPGENLVRHRICDNRPCCRYEHLAAGTHLDNMADRDAKGRQAKGKTHFSHTRPECIARGDRSGSRTHPESRPRGEHHWKSVVTDAQQLAICAEYDPPRVGLSALGRKYGIGPSGIQKIIKKYLAGKPSGS